MRKYFGTDGIRGKANEELTIELVTNLGLALGYYLKERKKTTKKPKVVLGTDTRISGYLIRSALSTGLTAMGVNIEYVGVLPTPGISYLTRTLNADAGIMISASHNPIEYNGIKIFANNGYKLLDEDEEYIEKLMDDKEFLSNNLSTNNDLGRIKFAEDYMKMYLKFLTSTVKNNFSGYRVVVDSANGASYRLASKVLQNLGAEVVVINNIPNGKNINVNCGSTNPKLLQEMVKLYNANIGLAFDGDADRLIAIDEYGNIVEGDIIIAIIAMNMKKNNILTANKVVSTVLTNMGVEKYLENNGISMLRSSVGDRYVLEKMKQMGLNLGGEQSGHIILLDYNTTGDGLLSGIQLISALINENKTLYQSAKEIELWPQKAVNLHVTNDIKKNWSKNKEVLRFIAEKEEEIIDNGRILVRASGTEPLIRIMVEANSQDIVDKYIDLLYNKLKEELK